MILRRLVAQLREQNWAAEFVLLVLGVFLGIQVSNWNAAIIERRDARDALQRLEEDLRVSITLTQGNAEFMAKNAGQIELVLDRLRACALAERDRDAFATGLYRLGKVMSARLVRTTFEELRDSGRLGLVGNADLRRALSETVRAQDSHEKTFGLQTARMDSHIAYVDSQVIFAVEATTGGGGQIAWSQLDIDFERACQDRRFQTAVAAVRNYSYDILIDSGRMQKRFEDLLALIEKENAR